jgi:hypothetical protein
MKLFSVVALAVGLINAQDIDPEFLLEGLGLDAAEILASDPEVDAALAAYEASQAASDDGSSEMERSIGLFGGASMFGNRNLPPGIQLMDFITPSGGFDTMAFLNALKVALDSSKEVKVATTTTAEPTTTLEVPAAYAYAYDSNYDYYQDYAADLEANANNAQSDSVGNRPGNDDGSDSKTFVGENSLGVDTDFTSCRICEDISPEACAAVTPTACVDTQNEATSDMMCRVSYQIRYNTAFATPVAGSVDGGNILMRSECVTTKTCEDSVRQNFQGPVTIQQCKPFNRLNRRFRTSNCRMCMKMGDQANTLNQLFPAGTSDGIVVTGSATTWTDLVNAPADFMTWSALAPQGQMEAYSTTYASVQETPP